MNDMTAIQQLLNAYSEAASRRDWDVVRACFAEDGIWEIPYGTYEGRDAALEAMAGVVTSFDYIVQINAPGVITIDGDSATTRSAIREGGKFAGKDEALEVLGHYNDRLVRTADGWKFAHRHFVVQGMHRFALLPAEG